MDTATEVDGWEVVTSMGVISDTDVVPVVKVDAGNSGKKIADLVRVAGASKSIPHAGIGSLSLTGEVTVILTANNLFLRRGGWLVILPVGANV